MSNQSILRELAVMAMAVASIRTMSLVYGAPPPGRNWKLVWQDNFEGQYDADLWKNWVNGTRSANTGSYHDNSKSLAFVNGRMQIRNWDAGQVAANTSNYPGCGGLASRSNYGPGYYECRLKSGNAWSCFWVQGIGGDCTPITAGCEFDIMENCCPGSLQHNIHWGGYKSCHKMGGISGTGPRNVSKDEFAVWALLWCPTTGSTFYVDGQETGRNADAKPNNTGQVRLSIESGGDKGNYFEIDWIRYYQDLGPSTAVTVMKQDDFIPHVQRGTTPDLMSKGAIRIYDIHGRTLDATALLWSRSTISTQSTKGSDAYLRVSFPRQN